MEKIWSCQSALQALFKSPLAQGTTPAAPFSVFDRRQGGRDNTTNASDSTRIFLDMAIFYLHPFQFPRPPIAVLSLWVAVSPPLLRFCEAKRWGQNGSDATYGPRKHDYKIYMDFYYFNIYITIESIKIVHRVYAAHLFFGGVQSVRTPCGVH